MQSLLVLIRDRSESQHPAVGEAPPPELPVMKFMQGVKLVIIDAVHGVLICALTDANEIITSVVASNDFRDGKELGFSMGFGRKRNEVKGFGVFGVWFWR